jgi:hypothetical protein
MVGVPDTGFGGRELIKCFFPPGRSFGIGRAVFFAGRVTDVVGVAGVSLRGAMGFVCAGMDAVGGCVGKINCGEFAIIKIGDGWRPIGSFGPVDYWIMAPSWILTGPLLSQVKDRLPGKGRVMVPV